MTFASDVVLAKRSAGCRLERRIGSGGFGVVYKAQSPEHGTVAIKIAHYALQRTSTQQRGALQNEIESLARLDHESLVHLFDYGLLDDGRLFLVMEFVHGEPLSRYLHRKGRLEILEALSLTRQVAIVLAYCHSRNLLHLDLKPQNIILVDAHTPLLKVLDFGTSRAVLDWKWPVNDVWVGTPAYMAPECCPLPNRDPQPSPQADLYALGCIFYELASGRVPVEGATITDLVQRKRSGDIKPLDQVAPAVPAAVTDLVSSLLEVDPGSRYPSAESLARRLSELYYETIRADRQSPQPRRRYAIPPSDQAAFAGREREISILASTYRRCVQEASSAGALVVGEAGLGKSRLTMEFLRRIVLADGALVGYGRCREFAPLLPYWSLIEALGQLLHQVNHRGDEAILDAIRGKRGEELAVLADLVPELGELVGRGHGLDIAARLRSATDRVAQGIASLLAAIVPVHPVVLVLEDLHWAGEGTLEVLAGMRSAAGPLLVVATARPEHAFSPGDNWCMVKLGPLDPAANKTMLAALLGTQELSPVARLLQQIPLLAAGNPFFNVQVVQNLEVEGHISRSGPGSLELAESLPRTYRPPDSVSEVLARNLEDLPPPLVKILAAGAMVGREFRVADVRALNFFAPHLVDQAVAAGGRLHLCWLHEGTCTFAHDSIREKLAASALIEQDRPALHRAIARRIREVGGSHSALAHHLEMAGESYQAAQSWLDAGLEADELHEPAAACHHLSRAADLLLSLARSEAGDALLLSAVYHFARIASVLGRVEATGQYLDRTREALRSAKPEQLIALDSSYSRMHYIQGDFAKAVAYSQKCLAAKSDDPRLRLYQCVPANIVGRILSASGKFGPAAILLERGCQLAREAHEYAELSHSEGVLSVALGYTGRYAESRARADAAYQLATQLQDPIRTAGALFYYGVLGESQFDWTLGLESTTRLLAYVEHHQISGLYLYTGTMFAGRHLFHLGYLERAIVLLRNALNLASLQGIRMGVGWAAAFLGDAYLVLGQLGEARQRYEEGLAAGNAGGKDEYAAALSLIGLAHHEALIQGDEAQARSWMSEALSRLAAVENGSAAVSAHQRFAEVLEAFGHSGDADKHRRSAEEQIRKLGIPAPSWRPADVGQHGPDSAPRPPAPASPNEQVETKPDNVRTRTWVATPPGPAADMPGGSAAASQLFGALSTVVGHIPKFLRDR